MNIYEQLQEIEKMWNMYELDTDEAIEKAEPLIEEFNEGSEKIALKYGQRPTYLSVKRFAFGKQNQI